MRRIALAVGLLALLAPRLRGGAGRATTRRSAAPRTASRTSRRTTSPASATATATRSREDNICVDRRHVRDGARRALALLRARRRRTRCAATASTANNLNSDFFYKRIIDARDDREAARPGAAATARGPRSARRCAATSPATTATCARPASTNLPDPRCRGKRVGAADRGDRRLPALLPARAARLGRRGDRRHRRRAAADARRGRRGRRRRRRRDCSTRSSERLPLGGIGSNAYGLGARRRPTTARACCSATRTSRGTAPSASTRRTSRSPARSTSAAASLFGVPVVLIGHTRRLAWSHTVSTAFRFTPFELKLVPGSPTTYLVDGQPQEMDARRGDGRRSRRPDGDARAAHAHALLDRSTGPIFTALLGLPLFPWTPAHRVRDGRRQRGQLPLPQPLLRDEPGPERARVRRRCCGATRASRGSTRSPPTRRGEAYYADISVVPHVTDEQGAAAATPRSGAATFAALRPAGARRLALGVRLGPRPERGRSPGLRPGRAPAVAVPRRLRHELQRLVLAVATRAAARGLRRGSSATSAPSGRCARGSGCSMVDGRADGSRCATLQDTVFNNRQYAGELWRDELRRACATRDARRSAEAVRRAARVGPARRPRLARRAAVPPLRRSGCSAPARGGAAAVRRAVRRRRPGRTRRAG